MLKGRIIKGIAGFYSVKTYDKIYICKARGLFRKKQHKPIVGDWVTIEVINDTEGYIQSILDRKNRLLRPEVSNIDLAILVFSIKNPKFQSLLLDKLTVMSEHYDMETIIIFNKCDLANKEEIEEINSIYNNIGYKIFYTSIDDDKFINEFKQCLKNKTSVFAGPSGVGKSTLMNKIVPGVNFQTGEISDKSKRGKHTTRHSEIVELDNGGFLIDTPGFSSLEMDLLDVENLENCFREFLKFSSNCKFRTCKHFKEPNCAVKNAVEINQISKSRYSNYCMLLEEKILNKGRKY